MKLYIESKRKLHEQYEANYICDAKYSDPAKQQLAEYFNDLIYAGLDNCFMSVPSIEGLPDPADITNTINSDTAIKNLVMALVEEYYGE